jgi:hypothetical protein
MIDRIDSQRSAIRRYLEDGRTISPMDALKLFGCYRLASAVHWLKTKREVPIKSKLVFSADGKRRFAIYWIGEKS